MTDEFDPVNEEGNHCKNCAWWQGSQESLKECLASHSSLLIRDQQLMDVLNKKRRLPDAELDRDIALVAHIMQHAEIAAQQLSMARMVLGGIVRNEYASDAGMAKATLEAMDNLEESVIPLNESR